MVFTIAGNKVQNVGYRLFILNEMKSRKLTGFPYNLPDGKQVSIFVWGTKKELLKFYDIMQIAGPKGVKKISLTHPQFDKELPPTSLDLVNEKMDLMIEQTGKFVEQGIQINKNLKIIPEKIAKAIKSI
ncbi:MAG TPA: acylphosphatase [archaeon]|nr:acylphosphatase [archaeon]